MEPNCKSNNKQIILLALTKHIYTIKNNMCCGSYEPLNVVRWLITASGALGAGVELMRHPLVWTSTIPSLPFHSLPFTSSLVFVHGFSLLSFRHGRRGDDTYLAGFASRITSSPLPISCLVPIVVLHLGWFARHLIRRDDQPLFCLELFVSNGSTNLADFGRCW